MWVLSVQAFIVDVPDFMKSPVAPLVGRIHDDVLLIWEAYCLRFMKKDYPHKYV